MADKNMKKSGWRVKLKDIGSDLYAIAVSLEAGTTSSNIIVSSGSNNVESSVTRSNNTVTYTANDVFGSPTASNSIMIFENMCNVNGSGFIVTGANLEYDEASVTDIGSFRLHLYNDSPTGIADNSAFNLPSGDRDKYLGFIDISTPKDLGDTQWSQNDNVNFKSECADSTNSIYGMLETIGALTPSAESVVKVKMKVVDV